MNEPIRILIADDHAIVREGLRALIRSKPGLELAGEAADGQEAIVKARELQPDVILMDLVMPRKDGIEAIREIKRENSKARILVLTSFSDDDKVFPAIKAGALGYLLKDSRPSDLVRAIDDVQQGWPSLQPDIALKVLNELNQPSDQPAFQNPLSPRELDVLRLVARGLSNQSIASELGISERTVRRHVSNILSTLHLSNRTQIAIYAIREGLSDQVQT
jgi:NarL family two-component system response regulator LiaR